MGIWACDFRLLSISAGKKSRNLLDFSIFQKTAAFLLFIFLYSLLSFSWILWGHTGSSARTSMKITLLSGKRRDTIQLNLNALLSCIQSISLSLRKLRAAKDNGITRFGRTMTVQKRSLAVSNPKSERESCVLYCINYGTILFPNPNRLSIYISAPPSKK